MRRLAALVLLLPLGGCGWGPFAGDPIDEYCEVVKEEAPGLTRTIDERGTEGLLASLPTLEDLGEEAPDDVSDDWRVLHGALHEFQDALEGTGIDPNEVEGELPADLSREERTTIRDAATRLLSPEVTRATAEVEQHALDVCKTPLL